MAVAIGITGCGSSTSSEPDEAARYSGSYAGGYVETRTNSGGGFVITCAHTFSMSGTVVVTLSQNDAGVLDGSAEIQGTNTETGAQLVSISPPDTITRNRCASASTNPQSWALKLSGTAAGFSGVEAQTTSGGGMTVTNRMTFTGTLTGAPTMGTPLGGVLGAKLTFNVEASGTNANGVTARNTGSTAIDVTLR